MAAEYSALLKWPQSKEEDLKFCLGKHSILILELELRKPHRRPCAKQDPLTILKI